MKSKPHSLTNEQERFSFIILCSQKPNKRGHKNIPLTPIDHDLLIDKQIKTIQSIYKNNEIILVSGFEHDRLLAHIRQKKYPNIRIAENKDYKNSSALDSWIFALNLSIDQNTFIIHGDRIFSTAAISPSLTHCSHTICHNVKKNNYDLGLLYENNRLVNISYGLPNVWSEIFFLHKNDFETARSLINEYKQQKFYNLDAFINALNKKVPIHVIYKSSQEVQTLKDL
jgi:choline kinase